MRRTLGMVRERWRRYMERELLVPAFDDDEPKAIGLRKMVLTVEQAEELERIANDPDAGPTRPPQSIPTVSPDFLLNRRR